MNPRTAALIAFVLGSQTLISVPAVGGESNLATIEKAIVIVTARGVVTSLGNAPAATQGTGFFISRDGYVVTSYHLRTQLGDVDERTVEYAIHFGPNDADTYQAKEAYSSPFFDIMVLYVSVGNRPYEILHRGSRDGLELGATPVYTGGYPEGYQFSVDNGVIKSLGTVAPIPAWSTSLTFKAGQSGSPIVRDDLRVIAIAKGNDANANSIGLVVPASTVPNNFWDGTAKLTAKAARALMSGESQTASVVYARLAVNDATAAQRQVTFKLQNDPCEASKSKNYRVAATNGWAIDPDSITVERLSSTGESTRFAVTDRSTDAFNVLVELANIGKCVNVFNRTIVAGVAADFTGVATFTEQPAGGRRFVTVSAASPFGDVQSPLPDVARNRYVFSIRKPDGTLAEFTPTGDELKKKDGVLVLNNKKVAERLLNEQF